MMRCIQRARLFAALSSALCIALSITPERAHAIDPQPDRTASSFWREAAAPGAVRAEELLTQARQQLADADAAFPMSWQQACEQMSALAVPLDLPGFARKRERVMAGMLNESLRRLTHVENAIARLESARQLAPTNPDALFALGYALERWERPGPLWSCVSQRRDAEAIAVYELLRAEHPQYQASAISFELAILYTRTLQFDRAVKSYAEGAPLALDPSALAMTLANWAEVTMLSGDVVNAVPLYERAVEAASDGRAYLLPLWGLAVALDRLGEREAAMEHLTRALRADNSSMSVLHSNGVFFEPASEIHYYEALGHEALSRMPGVNVQQALERALASWSSFFAEGGAQTRWASFARDNQQRIEQALTRLTTQANKPARKPSGTPSHRPSTPSDTRAPRARQSSSP